MMAPREFKTARQLRIKQKEYNALVKVLYMLEGGELVDTRAVSPNSKPPKNGFNMGVEHLEIRCGTVACIGGWMAVFMNEDDPTYYVVKFLIEDSSSPLKQLFWANTTAKSAKAARTIRHFLRTGDVDWNQ